MSSASTQTFEVSERYFRITYLLQDKENLTLCLINDSVLCGCKIKELSDTFRVGYVIK